MSRLPRRTARATFTGLVAGTLAASVMTLGTAAPAHADNVTTPGDFTGYGFDQCLAPTQKSMNAWLKHSPFLSVGIYTSGDSRACRNQPNLTPTWIRKQLARGWRLLPITLGPQASCQPRFPRYDDDETINPKPGSKNRYRAARRQGREEAVKAVEAAQGLGIVPTSTLWYDLEGFDNTNTHCRESALSFLSAWTTKLHQLNYVSGVYSSAGSGILELDRARINRPKAFTLPDQIWLARWDGVANTSSSYIREDGWRPHARIKQYQGGHDETWGGVRINIDRNFLDVGRGSWAPPVAHCGNTQVDFVKYDAVMPARDGYAADGAQVKALRCLLKEHGVFSGKVGARYNKRTQRAVNEWQRTHGFEVGPNFSRENWMSLLAAGKMGVYKFGSAGEPVRRIQRALNAARPKARIEVTGVFDKKTDEVLRAWQRQARLPVSGVVIGRHWAALQAGKR
ncbi:glycoside hydrolase domain-containing protein [Nocardioides sp.]|uniref:glycoside hydrolase domain-containing protein n=1 Tax=Nocardioides sp. TaxID=35761 RepID=UPI0035688E29